MFDDFNYQLTIVHMMVVLRCIEEREYDMSKEEEMWWRNGFDDYKRTCRR